MNVQQSVKTYYGETLKGSADLQTDACCTVDNIPSHIKEIMTGIHPHVSGKYYGCGLVAPELLAGLSVLDLGSGSGQDCFVLSSLVGEHGRVTGVDMTDAQLAVAEKHIDYHRKKFGYKKSNVEFIKGDIEQLDKLGLPQGSIDLIVSNCVLNLCQDKAAVLSQAWALLKEGGEFYFSDVYADRRVPAELLQDPVLRGECLSGALYWNDFLHLAKKSGFTDPRLVSDRLLVINNPQVAEKLGPIKFYSATYRLFKLPALEPACEDYGQAVIYKGTIPHCPQAFILDSHHLMPTGKVFPVCGNTWMMLATTRFKSHFDFIGSFETHYGIFEGCGSDLPFSADSINVNASCC